MRGVPIQELASVVSLYLELTYCETVDLIFFIINIKDNSNTCPKHFTNTFKVNSKYFSDCIL